MTHAARRAVAVAATVLTTVMVAGLAVGLLGVYFPHVRHLEWVAAAVAPAMSWTVVWALLAGLVAAALWWRRRTAPLAILAVASATVLLAAVVADARMVGAVERAGADVNVLDTLRISGADSSPPDVEEAFTTFGGAPLLASIYRPARTATPAPVLVYVHGGGWVVGDRNAKSGDLRWFADQGWLVATLDYTLSSADGHFWNVNEGQIACGLSWLAANAARFGGDPARLAMSGDSAGGNLAIDVAYRRAAGTIESSCGGTIPPVSAVSVLYPVVDPANFYANPDPATGARSQEMAEAYTGGSPQEVPDRYAAIDSTAHVRPGAPPILILFGEADHLVPVAPTYRFAEAARAAGVDVALVAVPHSDHVFDASPGSIGEQAYRQLTATWLKRHGVAP